MITVVLNLPSPPSANNLFPTGKNGRRFISPEYKAWREEAGWQLKEQRPPKIKGCVSLEYLFKEGRIDLGNLEKATTDLLVEHGVIEGDSPKVVREYRLRFAEVEGVRVTIVPVASASNETAEQQHEQPQRPVR